MGVQRSFSIEVWFCELGAPCQGMVGMLPGLFSTCYLSKARGSVLTDWERGVNMHKRDLERERTTLEKALNAKGLDFSAAYMAVNDLHGLLKGHPQVVRQKTVQALEGILREGGYATQTQSFFFYKEAADALASIVVHGNGNPNRARALSSLKDMLGTTAGDPKRACAEALGSLPIMIRGPRIGQETVQNAPPVTWQAILEQQGICNGKPSELMGRSLVLSMDQGDRLLVLKVALSQQQADSIHEEAVWMDHFSFQPYDFPVRFNIPRAIRMHGSYVFAVEDLPQDLGSQEALDLTARAVAFIAHKDYFTYPNDHRDENRLTEEAFQEVMSRNAWLFGKLASMGIVHAAPIPLFHNRVQRTRRADHGLYEWQRGGRLDRWLDSCLYPNFGVTGLRDFEHLVAFTGPSRQLYFHVGTELLSLLLVTGSYFRHKDRTRVGLDDHGNPVDARDLFDRPLLKELVLEIFRSYYNGFVGKALDEDGLVDGDALATSMIEEMGVDRYMEEVLRVVDQRRMTDEAFRAFLTTRGYTGEQVQGFTKGVEDIVILSGPHLGGFNERISLPELIDAVATMSALCMAGRYCKETGCS
ncbi:MAG: SidJ-related pseudokinase [Thermodesulfobacteriota bacterium]|nr:SidJ-related pseudokinase [Thermodesulfobacteriota bacterium]